MKKLLTFVCLVAIVLILTGASRRRGELMPMYSTSAASAAYVALIGTNSASSGAATGVITVADAVASGNKIVVVANSSHGISSITDTAGNSYSQSYQFTNSSPCLSFWLSTSGGALSISDTITVTWVNSGFDNKALAAVELTGVTALDNAYGVGAFSSSSVVTTNVTATPTVAISVSRRNGQSYTAAGSATVIASISITDISITKEEFTATGSLSTGGNLGGATSHHYAAAWFK